MDEPTIYNEEHLDNNNDNNNNEKDSNDKIDDDNNDDEEEEEEEEEEEVNRIQNDVAMDIAFVEKLKSFVNKMNAISCGDGSAFLALINSLPKANSVFGSGHTRTRVLKYLKNSRLLPEDLHGIVIFLIIYF